MKIENVTINNIRSYDEENIKFEDGLMLIHGDNGSGKSSLLSSIFGGLYLSNVLDYIDKDLNLDSLVRRTKDKGNIELTFSIGDDTYTVDWVISVTEKDGERSASSTSCTLTGDTIDEPIEGVKAVNSTIQEIIGMSPESFVNSVYVQQGDITRMVDANDNERKEIIDGLLGLSKLDTYIERMDEVRKEIGAQVRTYSELIEEKERQLNKYDDKSKLNKELSNLKSKKQESIEKKEKIQSNIEKYKKEKNNIKNKLDTYEEKVEKYNLEKSKLDKLIKKQTEKQTKQENAESEKEAINIEKNAIEESLKQKCIDIDVEFDEDKVNDKLDSVEYKYNEINTEVSSLKKGELNTINNLIEQIRNQIDELRDKEENHKSKKSLVNKELSKINEDKQETKRELSNLEKKLTDKKNELYDICKSVDLPTNATPEELRDTHIPNERNNLLNRSREIYESLGGESMKLTQKIEFNETGICPICDTTHDEKIHNLDELKNKKEKLNKKADSMEKQQELFDKANKYIDSISDIKLELAQTKSTLKQINQKLEDKNSRLSDIEQDINKIKDELSSKKETIEDKKEEKESLILDIDKKEKSLEKYNQKIEKLDNIVNMFSSLSDLNNEISSRNSTIEHAKEMKKEIRNQRLDKEQEVSKLKENIDDIDNKELKKKYSKKQNELQKLDDLLDRIENILNNKRDEIATVKQKLSQIESLEERYAELENNKIDASEKEIEAESVIETYKNVKTKLRKENIGLLNKYANDVFKSVYHSKVYQRLEIDSDYSIKLITGDGVKINPEELSGGEETIVSLAIRAGVYRLLVERNGNADKLPPFILDEPTTFLDTNHVSNLQGVIETINSWDVPQVIVVSHKNNLIQNADVSYEVIKNPATETSYVNKTKI